MFDLKFRTIYLLSTIQMSRPKLIACSHISNDITVQTQESKISVFQDSQYSQKQTPSIVTALLKPTVKNHFGKPTFSDNDEDARRHATLSSGAKG